MPPARDSAYFEKSYTVRVLRSGRLAVASNRVGRVGLALATFLAVMIGGVRGTQDAVANGDTRTLTFYHNNTKESLTVTFRRNGQYDQAALQQLNWFLRDWRRDEPTRMDPRLFDTVWEVYRLVGSSAPVHVNSAYRSPHTNAMLRRRSSGVAKHSQHMLGKALDFYLPDVPIEQLRAAGMRLQNGGVGYYPNAYTPFIHLDVGSVRAWPRMTRDQLVRLFPDGRTVHIPADGTPLAGYEEAKAEVIARGGTVAGYAAYAEAGEEGGAQPRRRSFWATLFGGSDEDEDAEEIRTASRPGRAVLTARRGNTPPQDDYASDSNASIYATLQPAPSPAQPARQAPPAQPRPEAPSATVVAAMAPALREDLNLPSAAPLPPTRINGLPSTVDTPSGPTLAWQQGPAGQNLSGSEIPIAQGLALVPMPPRRPGSDEPAEAIVLAYAPPLPPVRPGSLAATNPIPLLNGRAPVELAAIGSGGPSHPLPPPRPDARALTVTSTASIDVPATGSTPRDARPSKPQVSAEQKPPMAPKPTEQAPTALSTLLATQPSIHAGFSAKPVGDLATNRFTGPAVKPLPVVR